MKDLLEPMTEGTMRLDAQSFRQTILERKALYESLGSYPTVIVLPEELEPLIQHEFFKGRLNGFLKYDTDVKGRLRMYLAGVKTMFTKGLFSGHTAWVLDSKPPPKPDGTVKPPSNTPEPRPPTPPAISMAA